MLTRLASTAFGLALSLLATAQEPAVLSGGSNGLQSTTVGRLLAIDSGTAQPWLNGEANSVVPIWSGADGHLLAIVAVPGQWGSPLLGGTTAEPGPSSWLLLGGNELSQSGLRWQATNGFHLDALLGQNQSLVPALCGADCDVTRQGAGVAGSLGLGWMSPEGGLDLSYGLSWLQTRDTTQAFQGFGAGARVPLLTLPAALASSGLQSQTALFARGRWRFDEDAAFDVGASYGHGSTLPYGTLGGTLPGIDIDQLSLSLGVDAGSLRGAIVGHVLRSDDPVLIGRKWTALDLGVSWRTPWRAEISVGAQNLWSAPLDTPREADPAQARTPYIQYRQDL
jgi:hypothetical protein